MSKLIHYSVLILWIFAVLHHRSYNINKLLAVFLHIVYNVINMANVNMRVQSGVT